MKPCRKSIGKRDLLLELQPIVVVGVKEVDESKALVLDNCKVALVPKEVENFNRGDRTVAIPIESLEGGVRSEVADRAKALTGSFKASLAVSDSNKQIFKSAFRFKSK